MRMLLLTLTLLASEPVLAGWVQYGEADSGSFYFDPSTIKRNGDVVRVWNLTNNKGHDKSEAQSVVEFVEFNCLQGHASYLVRNSHSEKMGLGKQTDSQTLPSEHWYPVPTSAGQMLMKIVCK
jgi:hypothetical protein